MNAKSPALVNISLWTLDRPASEVAQLRRLLSAEERSRADRFIRPQDRDRWTLSRAGLRLLLAPYLGIAPDQITFTTESNGRPALSQPIEVSFNLSHSADVAALAISKDARVGVDVEAVRPIADDEIAWALSPAERLELSAVEESMRLESFFRFWTLKEAFMKGTGLGAQLPLHDFDMGLSPPRLVCLKDKSEAAYQWLFHEFAPKAGVRGAVTALTEGRPLAARSDWVELKN